MREIIEAKDGMILTNGEVYGKIIYLGEGVKKEDFYEITEEEYQRFTVKENDVDDYDDYDDADRGEN